MAKKKTINTNKNILAISIIGVIVLVLFVIVFKNQKSNFATNKNSPTVIVDTSPTLKFKMYKSDNLKISFTVPSSYKINESGIDVKIKNKTGEIIIVRSRTNNNSIEAAIYEISDTGKSQITNKQKLNINGIDVISCNIKSLVNDEPDSKGYYFYPAPWTVISITTNNAELFNDLNQIARSFRYEP